MKITIEHGALKMSVEPIGTAEKFFKDLEKILYPMFSIEDKSRFQNNNYSLGLATVSDPYTHISNLCGCTPSYVRRVMRYPNSHHSLLAHNIKAESIKVKVPTDGFWKMSKSDQDSLLNLTTQN